MCGLFGVIAYNQTDDDIIGSLVKALGKASEIRGTDAGGISYLDRENNRLFYLKGAGGISKNGTLDEKYKSSVIMGHTRMSTGGSATQNFNNHPFPSTLKKFVMSHNGIISNDYQLESEYKLVDTKVQTDSYIVVRLLDQLHEGIVNFASLKDVSEKLEGSFNLTFQDKEGIWIVKNNNPLVIMNNYDLGCYMYASTKEILMGALKDYYEMDLVDYLVSRDNGAYGEYIPITTGDILFIKNDGSLDKGRFKPKPTPLYVPYNYTYADREFEHYSNYKGKVNTLAKSYGTGTAYDEDYSMYDVDGYPMEKDDIADYVDEDDYYRQMEKQFNTYSATLIDNQLDDIYDGGLMPSYPMGLVKIDDDRELIALPPTDTLKFPLTVWSHFKGKLITVNQEDLLFTSSYLELTSPMQVKDFMFLTNTPDFSTFMNIISKMSSYLALKVTLNDLTVGKKVMMDMLNAYLAIHWSLSKNGYDLLTDYEFVLKTTDYATVHHLIFDEISKLISMDSNASIYNYLQVNLNYVFDIMYGDADLSLDSFDW